MTAISSAISATTPRSWVISIDRRAELGLEPVDQLEDLRLHGHVERGRRLVGDQQLRLVDQRHRDHRALAHAAGELVRVGADAAFGCGMPTRRRISIALSSAAALETSWWAFTASTSWSPTR